MPMKVAKPSKEDLDMSMELTNFLEQLDRGFLPDVMCDSDEEIIYYDEGKHAVDVVRKLQEIVRKGSLFRVCFGMSTLMNPHNEIVDPRADTLELHPRILTSSPA